MVARRECQNAAFSYAPAAETTSFLAILPPGVYEVACLAREGTGDVRMVHYDEGMYAVLAVRASVRQ